MLYVANDGRYIIKDKDHRFMADEFGKYNVEVIYPTDCFECDDMIAPAIAELLKKGYTTKYCCAGHFATDYHAYIANDSATRLINDVSYYVPYVMFNNKITKESVGQLPSSWRFVENKQRQCIIEANINKSDYNNTDNFFDLYKMLIRVCEDLYHWARDLKPLK